MSSTQEMDTGSYRDPKGQIYIKDGRIFRTVTEAGYQDFINVEKTGLLQKLIEEKKLVPYKYIEPSSQGMDGQARLLLEHPALPYISYPYEWGFKLLKSAAVLQLEIIIESLKSGVMLSDASAYNVQFNGTKPVFIDHLSFRPYQEGEYWNAHRQFCEQFLNPLLLRSSLGVHHNSWYRGALEGITSVELNKLIPLHKKLGLNMFTQVYLQAHFQSKTIKHGENKKALSSKTMPKNSLELIMKNMLNWILKLQPKDEKKTIWSDYVNNRSYTDNANIQKKAIVANYINNSDCITILDLGCNTGEYSEIAINAGADRVVAYDFDQVAIDLAFARAESASMNILPLYLDISNPPPEQGWMQKERKGFSQRATTDGLMALALVHHIAIGKNVPLEAFIKWLMPLAKHGIIEFVPKNDPMVQQLLMHREDIFPNYTIDNFRAILSDLSNIVNVEKISDSDRVIFEYCH